MIDYDPKDFILEVRDVTLAWVIAAVVLALLFLIGIAV